MLAIVDNPRRKQLEWINAILEFKGWRPARLAKAAAIDHSTLSKFLNDPLNAAHLNSTSVEKIAAAGGIPPYHKQAIVQARGFAESEAELLIDMPSNAMAAAIDTLKGGQLGADVWVMKSRALENAGFLPGDIMIVDLNAEPRDGDAVCVQLYDRAGRAETAFRIYESPFLVAASSDPVLRRPVLVDNERAIIRGVVTATLRPRLSN